MTDPILMFEYAQATALVLNPVAFSVVAQDSRLPAWAVLLIVLLGLMTLLSVMMAVPSLVITWLGFNLKGVAVLGFAQCFTNIIQLHLFRRHPKIIVR